MFLLLQQMFKMLFFFVIFRMKDWLLCALGLGLFSTVHYMVLTDRISVSPASYERLPRKTCYPLDDYLTNKFALLTDSWFQVICFACIHISLSQVKFNVLSLGLKRISC